MTDEKGDVVFEGLKPGIYLVTGDSTLTETRYFIPIPTMIAIPDVDEDDRWVYDREINAKYESGERNLTDIIVVKIWEDNSWKPMRPGYVTVHLYGNGEKVDEIRLNKYNNWRYTWENLDGAVVWKVVEKPIIVEKIVEVEKVVEKVIEIPKIKRVQRTKFLRNPVEFGIVGVVCFILGLLTGYML